ncbi:integrase core domain-containing protein [Sulfidibacter corallicola]|uniref:DDE-type integrase/transposase/recombinase n=1 Tax=Sulfidibacter corallicola TaxID=2818388 RepID=UPI001F0020E7|nr:DDE-type integrase/transposase/recombinase [Sulfidibacter corallicola]
MYRILQETGAAKERRAQRRHPAYIKPQLIAEAPNQIWTWDISKLPGHCKGIIFCLYVLLDKFSRYVVGWTIEETESTTAAKRLVKHAVDHQGVDPDQLTIHADRGAPMTSKGPYALFDSLGVRGAHSRPRVSNDNPYSEAHFKTVKYHPLYPKRFTGLAEARHYFDRWFGWYNRQHHHINLGLFTPAQVHDGSYREIQATRQQALDEAYRQHPERFVKGPPRAPTVPRRVAINPDSHDEAANPTPRSQDHHNAPMNRELRKAQDATEAHPTRQGEKS